MEKFEDSFKFKSWRDTLLKHNIKIHSIRELHTVNKHNGEMLFTLVHMDAVDPDGHKLLPVVLIRGHFVVVVTCLIEKESGNKYFLLVKQRRVANGDIFYEHPAGMCDSEPDPWKVAVKEVKEETGLEITKENLRLLHPEPLYSSAGLLDEAGYFFACDITLSKAEIDTYRNRSAGAADENEVIITHVCTLTDVFSLIRNSNGLLATHLYVNDIKKELGSIS
ncbi:MAG TPA: NUDIX hydrolase [Leptospiraceae bacterium]|nr:NUDIX hydrolase [Leptospiraceae bacterium]HMW03895.1 NUDIX hydrolase [Leptospiraceae bacterium]HMX32391.1 NUDIX hydrolase [Leptospiraceae bacterium]HMY29875.1 NUDIX hydrolase [Leptospiraceae bacterium]HMZ62981.1 NUDIX hydrolase [Leptospiraceae bacterium]